MRTGCDRIGCSSVAGNICVCLCACDKVIVISNCSFPLSSFDEASHLKEPKHTKEREVLQ